MSQTPFREGRYPNWYHESCFFIKQHPPSAEDVENLENLRYEDQERVKRRICDEVRKWQARRDTFARYIKANITDQSKNSEQESRWSGHMEPHSPFLSHLKSELTESDSNIDFVFNECEGAMITNLAELNSTNTWESDTAQHRLSSQSPTSTLSRKPTSSVECLINYLESKIKPEMSEMDMLFAAYASNVKKFSLKRQAITKMKISQVIMEQELEHLEEQTSIHMNEDNEIQPSRVSCSSSSVAHSQSISPNSEHVVDSAYKIQKTKTECVDPSDEPEQEKYTAVEMCSTVLGTNHEDQEHKLELF